ncbi:MAG: DUF1974 domain-containing protein, partial [Pseudomonadota bacterium]
FCGHVGFVVSNVAGAFFHNLTGGLFAPAPMNGGTIEAHYRQLSRGSRTFALVADLTVSLLGGDLKAKQRIAGRLADALSEIYLISSMLKRFEDDGRPREDLDTLQYCVEHSLVRFDRSIEAVVSNFPIKVLRPIMRVLCFPLGMRRRAPSDALAKKIVRQVMEPGAFRDRMTKGVFVSHDPNDVTGVLEVAMEKVIAAEAIEKKLEKAIRAGSIRRFHGYDWFADAEKAGVLTADEVATLREMDELVSRVIAVDHFDPEAVKPNYQSTAPAASMGLAAE